MCPERSIALLRGVDVGRAKRIVMADPRALAEPREALATSANGG